MLTADSAASAETASFSALGGSSFARTTCARPLSSRTTRNCTRFWSRTACTQPRIVTCSPTFPRSCSMSVRSTPRTLSEDLRRVLGRELDDDRELLGLDLLEQVDRARLEQITAAELQPPQAARRVVHDDARDRRAHRPTRLGLGLA